MREQIQSLIDQGKYCDSVSKEHLRWIVENFEFTVNREGEYGFNEAYLGHGYIWSTTDYGKAWKITDEEIVETVKKNLLEWFHQYIKFCVPVKRERDPEYESLWKTSYLLGDTIEILVSKTGYAPQSHHSVLEQTLEEVIQLEQALANDHVDVSLSTMHYRSVRVAELKNNLETFGIDVEALEKRIDKMLES